MTAFAREGAVAAARLRRPAATRTTTRSCRSSRTTPTRQAARSTCSVTPALSVFGRYGWRDLEHRRPAAAAAAVGRRRQRHHLRAQQAARARRAPTCRATRRCSRSASAGPNTQGGQEPAGAGIDERVRRRTASPGLPTDPRIAGGLPTQTHHRLHRISAVRRRTRSGSTRRSSIRR